MTTIKLTLFLFLVFFSQGFSQTLPLKEALETGIANYGTIKAKSNYADASKETIKQVRREYLPNVTLSGQQDYGTVNGQNGPLYGFGGLGVASSGLPLEKQNWNAAFGALYLVNVNWDFFTFGRMKEKINLSKAESQRYEKDLDQEKFQHKIKIAAAYLNLLASQRLLISQRKNLERAQVFQHIAAVRVKNGLLAGVDSTLASAEVSRSKITLNQVKDQVKEQNNKLVALMGISIQDFVLDTAFVTTIPKAILAQETSNKSLNPILEYHKSRAEFSEQQLRLFKKEYYPTFSVFGIYQARASGFNSDYAVNQNSFSQNYVEAPKQVQAAQQAYLQKTTLYKNGMTNLLDVTQTLYTLNRAETDRDIIYTNVWQSLLIKAAATGDFDLFMNEF